MASGSCGLHGGLTYESAAAHASRTRFGKGLSAPYGRRDSGVGGTGSHARPSAAFECYTGDPRSVPPGEAFCASRYAMGNPGRNVPTTQSGCRNPGVCQPQHTHSGSLQSAPLFRHPLCDGATPVPPPPPGAPSEPGESRREPSCQSSRGTPKRGQAGSRPLGEAQSLHAISGIQDDDDRRRVLPIRRLLHGLHPSHQRWYDRWPVHAPAPGCMSQPHHGAWPGRSESASLDHGGNHRRSCLWPVARGAVLRLQSGEPRWVGCKGPRNRARGGQRSDAASPACETFPRVNAALAAARHLCDHAQ